VTHARLTSATSGRRRTSTASIVLAPLLRGPRRTGRLLGASRAAIYLRFDIEAPGVVALLPPSSVRLPLGVVVSGTLPAITAHHAVAIGEGSLSLGDDAWVPGGWFDPRPRTLTAADPIRVAAAASVLSELSAADVGVDADRARAAVMSLMAGEAQPACGLLGDGPGLTPAGDDVVAGALAACALLRPETRLGGVPEILAGARRATTSLSAALLSCAAAGQVVPEAAEFLAALCGEGDVAIALAALRSVGSTSGTALAVGIVAALDADAGSIRDAHAGGAA
jgi:hypothetical protein